MEPGDVRIVRAGVLSTAAVGVVVVIVAGVLAGRTGVYGALLGTALAMAFFAITIVAVSAAGRVANELMLPAAIGIGLALFFLRDTTAFNRTAFALATVTGACVFMVAELRFALRARTPYVTTPRPPGG